MNSEKDSRMPPQASSKGMLWLTIRGLGPICSFKNSKQLIRLKNGKPGMITKPDYKKQMEAIVNDFVSQCQSKSVIIDGEMRMAHCPQYSTVSFLPEDDSLNYIPEIHVHVEHVPKGEEGAEIIIEKL